MAGVGRKDKFTEENRQAVFNGIRDGLPYQYAAAAAGISRALLHRWLQIGRMLIEINENGTEIEHNLLENLDADKENEYMQFVIDFDKAESDYLQSLLKDMHKSNKKWLLTKRFREHYDDTQNVNINANVNTEITWKDFVQNAKDED